MTTVRAFLLDTHVLLWWLNGDPRIVASREANLRQARCLVSAASIWEAAIKHRLGKLPLPPGELIQAARTAGFEDLPITFAHAEASAALPLHHHDPFDRLLIAQARVEGVRLLSADRTLKAYGRGVEML